MLEGQWVDVPDDAVLDVPNKYGKAVVWYSKSWRSTVTGQEGGFDIRCFLPGGSLTKALETTRSSSLL